MLNRADKRKIKNTAEKVWTLENKIANTKSKEDAAKYKKELLQILTPLLNDFEKMMLLDEYIIEKYGTSTLDFSEKF